MAKKQTPESFWVRVDKHASNGCWEWTGALNNTGYGNVAWHGKRYTTHRVAAWLSGMVDSPSRPASAKEPTHVLHRCDNRKCCNPDHFFLGTFTDNMLDAYQKGRKVQPTGSDHINAKLTPEQIRIIRNRYADGAKQIPLAKEFGVSQRCVSLIVRGETYQWI